MKCAGTTTSGLLNMNRVYLQYQWLLSEANAADYNDVSCLGKHSPRQLVNSGRI